jgi:adenylate kinase
MLQNLRPTLIAMLYAEAHEIARRIALASEGRPPVSEFQADLHIALQAQVAVAYGLQLGLPVYVFDSTDSLDQVTDRLASKLNEGVAASA